MICELYHNKAVTKYNRSFLSVKERNSNLEPLNREDLGLNAFKASFQPILMLLVFI